VNVAQPLSCPTPWTFLSHGCYLFLTSESTNWSTAKNTCEDLNAHLVKIETAEENEELYNEAVRLGMTEVTAWIGLNDMAEEGTWIWTDGTRVDFTNWSQSQPDNAGPEHNEDCAELNTFTSTGGYWAHPKKWNDRPCNVERWAICELNM